jgi:hypothetical protein
LRPRTQVNEKISATEQIQPGEWRVNEHVLLSKDNHLPDLAFNSKTAFFFYEELPQTLLGYILGDIG